MFVKVQDANDLVNLDRVAEIRMKEEQGEYIIEAIYQDGTHFPLASYKSKTGVSFYKKNNKWGAHIKVNDKFVFLGLYEHFDDAVKARKEAEDKYYGEFSYYNSQSMRKENVE